MSAVDRPRSFRANAVYSDTDAVEVAISWAPAQFGDAQNYVLYKNGVEYQTFGTDVTEFIDTDVVANTTYEYYMVATNADGSASSIETQHISVIAVAVGAPTNLKRSVVNKNDIYVSWSAADFADAYIVYLNGEIAGTTTNTEFTIENVEFNKQYIVSVVSQNASGALSNETVAEKLIIDNPDVVESVKIFDDAAKNGFSLDSSVDAKIMLDNDLNVKGTSSLMIDFTTRNYNRHIAGFKHNGYNMTSYRNNGGNIAFWIYADYEFDWSNIDFALGSSNTYNNASVDVYSKVNLADYVSGYGEWKYVSIPLSAFADKGTTQDAAYEIAINQKFNQIKYVAFMTKNSAVDTLATFFVDEVTITSDKKWKVTAVTANDGTATTEKIPTNATSFKIAVDKDTANELFVWIEDNAGNVIDTDEVYDNGVYEITLLEALAPDANYTVNVSGKNSTETINFVTDSTPAGTLETKIPAIGADITTTSNGAVLNVAVAFDGDMIETVKKYGGKADFNITLTYDSDVIELNGDGAATLKGAFKNAGIRYDEEKITISGKVDAAEIDGNIVEIEFVKESSGDVTIKAEGTAKYYNGIADKDYTADVKGSKTVTVSVSGGSIGGGGGSSSGGLSTGAAANRVSAPAIGQDRYPATVDGKATEFSDINNVAWAAESIKYLAEKGYISGYPDGTFMPEKSVTRAEFVKMCVTVFAVAMTDEASSFVDVENGAWYTKYIAAAEKAGLVNGISETHFGVNETISREDMCTIISRIIAKMYITTNEIYDAPVFDDRAEISEYAKAAVANLYKAGIINGVSATEFSPKTNVNRAMAAKVLYAVEQLTK